MIAESGDALILAAIAFVALQHIAFMIIEMFYWHRPLGMRLFRIDEAFAIRTRSLAANQGLYNGFLAAGLVWSLYEGDAYLASFFLGCVAIAGIFGAVTVNRRILWIQAAPAIFTMVLITIQ